MIPIFDGHNDTLLRLVLHPERDFGARGEGAEHGHIDLPRAREGGLVGGVFAVFPPSGISLERTQGHRRVTDDGFRLPPSPPMPFEPATRHALAMVAKLFELEARGLLRVCVSVADIRAAIADGVLAAVLHFEGAEAIDEELHALRVYHRAGLRSLGLVWSRPNAFGTGVPFSFPASPDQGPGLTVAGRELVAECDRLGIVVDVSHLNAAGFWDVAEISTKPLVASHSNAYALSRSARNLTDEQLDALRASGGLVGLNFATAFLRADGASDADTPLDAMVRHLDHLLERCGEDGVAFGSDFDGAVIPAAIGDVAGLPRLLEALRAHGYDEALVRKLACDNWLRVLEATWGA